MIINYLYKKADQKLIVLVCIAAFMNDGKKTNYHEVIYWFAVWVLSSNMHVPSEPVLESKGMHEIFQKKGKKRQKNVTNGKKGAKYLKI